MSVNVEGAYTKGTAGYVAWIHSSLAVDDLAAAIHFFETAFGFQTTLKEIGMDRQIEQITGASGLVCDLVQLRQPETGHTLELIKFHHPAELPSNDALPIRPGGSHVAFVVEDLTRAKLAVEDLGAVTLGEITMFEEGPAIYCRVPGGAFIELEQVATR